MFVGFQAEKTMTVRSKVILVLLNEFVYEHRGNNTYVTQEKTALILGKAN
mgnify:CR=1 FL=1